MRERALPSGVRGPVLLAALRLFAAICFSEANFTPPLSLFSNRSLLQCRLGRPAGHTLLDLFHGHGIALFR
jgi:hypothetical protein